MTLTESMAGTTGRSPALGRSLPLHVEVIADYTSFLDLEPVWNRLAAEAELEHPFLEHFWIRTWWECFGPGSRMRVLLVRDGARPIAIAPLIETSVRMCGIPLRRLGFFYNAHVPRSGFIVARKSQEAHRAIWKHLLRDGSWDVLQLCQLPEGSDTLESISQLAATSGHRIESWMSGESPYIPIRTPWDEYFSGLSAKHRANLRNRMKRLAECGPATVETVSSEDALPQALADSLRLEAAAWKGRAGSAIACDPSVARFYSLLARRAAQHGWLRLRFLKSAAERIAVDYSLCYRDRTFLLKHGYDPAFSRFSPSQLLLQFAIECAFDNRLSEYEILGDNTEWKQAWTRAVKKHFWLYVFSNGLKARLAHAAKFHMIPLLKRALRGRAN